MAYTDPTDFVDGTNGVHYDTNVKEANLQHVIVSDDAGNAYDYLIVEGQGGETELWTLSSDGSATLQQTLTMIGGENQQYDPFTVINDKDSHAVYLFDTDASGSNVMSWDPATASWSVTSQPEIFFGSGRVYLDVFQADNGTIYGYSGGSSDKNSIDQWVFDETTKTFIADTSYIPSTDLGANVESTFENSLTTKEMQVLITNDGPKLVQWTEGISRAEGFTLYDIDPATGQLVSGSASSYNFATAAEDTNFNLEAEFIGDAGVDEMLARQGTATIKVDVNGNIVIANGSWGTTETTAPALIVIDPRLSVPDSTDATQDGDGDVDNSASILTAIYETNAYTIDGTKVPATSWGSNPEITYSPDGEFMYITSENTTGSLDPENTSTIVVNTSTYEIIDFGTDTTSGYYSADTTNNAATTDNTGAMSQIIATLSTGEQYYIGQYSDTANADAGWLSIAPVTSTMALAAICFVSGTLIETKIGLVPIENLEVGDMVTTKDHGLQPIRWIGSSKCEAKGNLAPVLIRKGALGNFRDLKVSPQHRMLVSGWKAELLFGESEVLVAAKHLVNDHSITTVESGEVEYFHILFDRHEIIFAEGAPSESFHPGAEGLKSITSAQAEEIFEIFPKLRDSIENYGISCRPSLKLYEAKLLAEGEAFPYR